MLFKKKEINISIKLYGGLDADLGIEGYDGDAGVNLQVTDKIRLMKAIRKIGIRKTDTITLFINGNPVGPKERLHEGDVILCMRPLAGG